MMFVEDVGYATGSESANGRKATTVKQQIMENKYEDALAKAQAGKSLEEVFPELRESEDERIRKELIDGLRATGWINFTENLSIEDAIAYLERQKGQKPAEWSEDDERIRNCLIRDQEEALKEVRNDKYGHSEIISDKKEMYRERIDWLKSLRPQPHWKPSEEQMRVLSKFNDPVVKSLYNDLKNL